MKPPDYPVILKHKRIFAILDTTPFHALDASAQGNIYRHISSGAFDLHAVSKSWEGASETRSERPVVQVAEVAFEGWIDEPLVVFCW